MIGSIRVQRDVAAGETGLTSEAFFYLCLCGLALFWRLLAGGSGPLSPGEAQQALAAHHLSQGSPALAETADPSSPLLLSLQALLFALFGAHDALARLPVVVLTSLSPLAFWLLRPLLGRLSALMAAGLLVLSPCWTVAGAQGLGAGLGATALLFAFALAVQAAREHRRVWASSAGAALAAALASSGEAWGGLLVGMGVWLLLRRRRGEPRLSPLGRHWQSLSLSFLGTLMLLSTAGGLYPKGLQGVVDLPSAWAFSFVRPHPDALPRQVLLLLVYEPLLLVLGLATIAFVFPSTDWRKAIYLWTGVTLLMAIAGGRHMSGVLLALPALAVLSAEALQAMARWWWPAGNSVDHPLDGRLRLEGLAASFALLGYGYVAVSGLAERGGTAFLVLSLTALGIGGSLLGLVLVRRGATAAVALVGMGALLVLVPWTLSNTFQGVGLRHAVPSDLLRAEISRQGLSDLLSDVERLSWSRTSSRHELPLMVEERAGPLLLGWYLRDMRRLQWVREVPAEAGTEAIITSGAAPILQASVYVGQDYVIASRWRPSFGGAREFLRWLLFRQGGSLSDERVTLWVQEGERDERPRVLGGT